MNCSLLVNEVSKQTTIKRLSVGAASTLAWSANPFLIMVAVALIAIVNIMPPPLAHGQGFGNAQSKNAGRSQVAIQSQVDQEEVFVGESIRLTVVIDNAQGVSPKGIDELHDDFDVNFLGERPSHQSSTTIINGRMTSHSLFRNTLEYELVTRQLGTYTIPELSIEYQGEIYKTKPISIKVVVPEAQDNVIAELVSSKSHVYPTQSFDVTLQIFIKDNPALHEPGLSKDPLKFLVRNPPSIKIPWIDAPNGLSSQDPSRWLNALITEDGSGFSINNLATGGGIFFDSPRLALFDLYDGIVKRKNSEGEEVSYHKYSISRSFKAEQPGVHRLGAVMIKGTFPLRYDGDRLLGKKIAVLSNAVEIEAKEVPRPRPDTFIGGIGAYSLEASATPTICRVGDPVTLTVGIRADGSNLELVSAPKLHLVPEIRDGFELLDPDPIGVVDGDVKRYRYALRPKTTAAKIPALKFHTFDPEKETFVEIESQPIELKIDEAQLANLTSNAGDSPFGRSSTFDNDAETRDANSLPNGSGVKTWESIRISQPIWTFRKMLLVAGGAWGASLLAIAVAWAVQRWKRGAQGDRQSVWLNYLEHRLPLIQTAQNRGDQIGALTSLRDLISGMLTDELPAVVSPLDRQSPHAVPLTQSTLAATIERVGSGRVATSGELVRLAEETSLSPELLKRLNQWLQALDAYLYGGGGRSDAGVLVEEAMSMIKLLPGELWGKDKRSRNPGWGGKDVGQSRDNKSMHLGSMLWGTFALGVAMSVMIHADAVAQSSESNPKTGEELLSESSTSQVSNATEIAHPTSLGLTARFAELSKELHDGMGASQAEYVALELEKLLNEDQSSEAFAGGSADPNLITRIGDAWLLAGNHGKAIYCYEIALRAVPSDRYVYEKLITARRALANPISESAVSQDTSDSNKSGPLESADVQAMPVWRMMLPSYGWQLATIGVLSSVGALLFGIGIIYRQRAWWGAGLANIPLCILLGWLAYTYSPEKYWMTTGVIVRNTEAREGMSRSVGIAFPKPLSVGESIRVLHRTPNWTQVQHPQYGDAWVESDSLIYRFQ